ncbi:MAG TPA: hypothetical protein PLM93_11905 [Sulfuricurvum sp.]|nr:MAG: hypothetical protein B7Y30_11615 [Campylobacterales bacterium 16-40-21]OZA02036.1 MAG: hypothetical protein B7X89_10965 [Sulfuricurvum sp. 17-40-25]HQS67880.1 hypothetical protein [Sulfuricurvum sp.]HQT37280.1 hypothetical protein [Sulfuricurvum sp.]
MIHDLFKAAGRVYGFLKTNPGATPDQIRKWLEIIDADQSKIILNKSRFSGFKTTTASALRRYEEDIDILNADSLGERAIHSTLLKRYPFAKNIPSASTIRRFLERKNG